MLTAVAAGRTTKDAIFRGLRGALPGPFVLLGKQDTLKAEFKGKTSSTNCMRYVGDGQASPRDMDSFKAVRRDSPHVPNPTRESASSVPRKRGYRLSVRSATQAEAQIARRGREAVRYAHCSVTGSTTRTAVKSSERESTWNSTRSRSYSEVNHRAPYMVLNYKKPPKPCIIRQRENGLATNPDCLPAASDCARFILRAIATRATLNSPLRLRKYNMHFLSCDTLPAENSVPFSTPKNLG